MSATSRRASRAIPLIGLFLLWPDPLAAQSVTASTRGDAVQAETPMPVDLMAGLRYRYVGPSRGGRVTAVAGHRAQKSTFYMGATGGGLWKTTDNGQNWRNLSDGYFATGSIGAIAVAPSDPETVYVGTGSDGLRSNVIVGKGVYRSANGGESWTHVGLDQTGHIGAVLVHPADPDLVYVAAIGDGFGPNPERGAFRSRDAGETWGKVLFISDSTGVVDLEFAPDDASTIYAVSWRGERKPWTIISGAREGGVYRSVDAGDSWTHLTDGLPGGLRGKGDLAVSAADPDRIYVLIEAPGTEGGVYRSDDRGDSWRQVSDFQPIRNRPFYYTNLHAHPTNADILWGMAEGYWYSEDGGESWSARRTPHGDNHDLWINPDDPNIQIQSNDGGANVTLDGGQTWSTQLNQPTAELYQVDLSDAYPYRLYAGKQDEGSAFSVPSLPEYGAGGPAPTHWRAEGSCETGPAVPKPGDPDIVFTNCKGRFGVFNRRTGQEQHYYVGYENLYGANPGDLEYRFQRVVPIHVSPHDPEVVYHGSQFVHRTRDGGRTWETISPDLTAFDRERQMYSGGPITIDITGEEHYSVLYDIQESPHELGVIWAGANDGPVHVTRDGGANWTDVTPPMPPLGRVQTIEVSPHDPAKAYVAVLRYQLDDWEPYGFRTEDYGQTWTRITTGSNGIPADHPLRVIREDPERSGLLYGGTEFGMFISFDDGESWQSFQRNLPITPVTDIKVFRHDLVLSTMGRGFWIMDDLMPLHFASAELLEEAVYLFPSRPAYRTRISGGRGPRSEAAPEYPRMAAHVDYLLGLEAGEILLEILDPSGSVVRSFGSEGPGPVDVEIPTMHEYRIVTRGSERVSTEKGFHRFEWNLRHPGAWTAGVAGAPGSGPIVAPGEYTARLTVDGITHEQQIEVRMDPRVLAEGITGAEVEEQIQFAVVVRDLLSEARMTVALIEEEQASAGGDVAAELDRLHALMVTASTRYSRPMLVDQIDYLSDNIQRADGAPSADARARYQTLLARLEAHVAELERVLKTVAEQG